MTLTWDVSVHAAPGARFVSPDEYREHKHRYIGTSMVDELLTDALAAAADTDGVLENFDQPRFYATCLRDEMREDEDSDDFQLTYDRFAAVTLTDRLSRLMLSGLLGNRGKGDSFDYRLTLPESPT